MKIKRLEICGFKSFVDRTVVNFDHDVTGVVGPNGCGKSNIVDAMRWAMGEQSAKHLRGKAMEDVIFNGCESRGPSGLAEVTITFDNADGLAPPEFRDYAEIGVTRRLDRTGASEYLINKTPVRLMDVTNLFLGTGVGTKAYSIIEQGRIGLIVSAKPEDRRHLIEEAAGVTKFKVKKKAAERKMDQTRQNLLRVHDIIGEIERSLSSLKRQAQKAERYKNYRAEIRELEFYVATHRWLELTAALKQIQGELTGANERLVTERTELDVREAGLETQRLAVHEIEGNVERAQTRSYELDNSVSLLESQVARLVEHIDSLKDRELSAERELTELGGQRKMLDEERAQIAAVVEGLEAEERTAESALEAELAELEHRRAASDEVTNTVTNARGRVAEAETRIARAEAILAGFERRREEARARAEKLRAEHERMGQRAIELDQQADELRARLEGLRSGKEQTAARRSEMENELSELRREIQESDRTLERVREELASRRSRLYSLDEIHERFEGVGAGVRAVMTHFGDEGPSKGVHGLFADRLDCPHELTAALAGALGEKLQYIVVDDLRSGLDAASYLSEGNRGRATLVPRSARAGSLPPPRLEKPEGAIGVLADLVGYDAADEALVRTLLGDVIVVEDLEAAVRLHESGFDARAIVTRKGEVIAREGFLTGGGQDEVGAHMLDVKREMKELGEIVSRLDSELTTAVNRHGELRKGIAQRQASIEGARTEAHDAEIAIVTAEKDLRRAEEDRTRIAEQLVLNTQETEQLERSLASADDEEQTAQTEVRAASEQRTDAQEELTSAEAVATERRNAFDHQTTVVTEMRVRTAQAKQKVESDRAAMERLMRSIGELDSREGRLRGDLAQCARQQGETTASLLTTRENLATQVTEAMTAREALATVKAEYDAARAEMAEHEGAMKELRATLERLNKEVSDFILRDREVSMDLEHLLEQVQERHRVALTSVVGDYHDREVPDESVRTRIDELARLIERMGEINLTAIEEYDEQSKRFEFYSTQKNDLDTALDQLDKAIRQMNRESRRLFRETFEAVNLRFQKMFPRMFGGGKAELKLTNPEDVLESGVEIFAQPPGKRLGSIELMSGGEKALTAVSLIFAIFQHKPSPFCLLDEVDAPLDEANIDRFAEAIRQMTDHSQFIVITHSKRTMETTDVLYGVTMETPGISKLVSVELRRDSKSKSVGEEPMEAAVA